MKKIKLITCLTILSFSVSAQSLLPIRYGVKIGGNLSNIMSTANDGVKNMQNASIFGIAGGFYMEIALTDKWYIKPEIIYIQKGASLTSEYVLSDFKLPTLIIGGIIFFSIIAICLAKDDSAK